MPTDIQSGDFSPTYRRDGFRLDAARKLANQLDIAVAFCIIAYAARFIDACVLSSQTPAVVRMRKQMLLT
ncbi:hypothetical protein BaRGS_00021965 [Batillaria attramentaria]|uniref:Uncharacterized protein n=1 Tax=Batillaria attramentaria TaxID=370345 RepID=A0ABD0KHV5_9CAEN